MEIEKAIEWANSDCEVARTRGFCCTNHVDALHTLASEVERLTKRESDAATVHYRDLQEKTLQAEQDARAEERAHISDEVTNWIALVQELESALLSFRDKHDEESAQIRARATEPKGGEG